MADQNFIVKLSGAQIKQQNVLIVKDINLEVRPGEFIYLIGKTGSGKTSLLRMLYGELPLKEGQGEVEGFNLRDLNQDNIPFLRRKLGIVFQDFQLLTDRNVRDNLLFVMKATGWKNEQLMLARVTEVLRLVGLEEKASNMPHELSGGEQQRIVIARALINEPGLILADEPTGNLDPETADEVINLLHKISKNGTAIFMATHDYSVVEKFTSRIIKAGNYTLIEQS